MKLADTSGGTPISVDVSSPELSATSGKCEISKYLTTYKNLSSKS